MHGNNCIASITSACILISMHSRFVSLHLDTPRHSAPMLTIELVARANGLGEAAVATKSVGQRAVDNLDRLGCVASAAHSNQRPAISITLPGRLMHVC